MSELPEQSPVYASAQATLTAIDEMRRGLEREIEARRLLEQLTEEQIDTLWNALSLALKISALVEVWNPDQPTPN